MVLKFRGSREQCVTCWNIGARKNVPIRRLNGSRGAVDLLHSQAEQKNERTGRAIAELFHGGVIMAVNREELVECLNDLIQTCRDGENGFQTAADHVKD